MFFKSFCILMYQYPSCQHTLLLRLKFSSTQISGISFIYSDIQFFIPQGLLGRAELEPFTRSWFLRLPHVRQKMVLAHLPWQQKPLHPFGGAPALGLAWLERELE